jgi:hypothetical protein
MQARTEGQARCRVGFADASPHFLSGNPADFIKDLAISSIFAQEG